MARSLPLLAVAMILLVVFLVPADGLIPLGALLVGKIGSCSVRLRPQHLKNTRSFAKHAGDIGFEVYQETVLKPPPKPGAADDDDNKKPPPPPPPPPPPETGANTAGLYIFNLSIGTPVQAIAGVLDITLSFVWVQCDSCTSCLPAPTFRRKASGTFASVNCAGQTCVLPRQRCRDNDDDNGCGYTVNYISDDNYISGTTNTTGYLAIDTFTFGVSVVPGVEFGCSVASSGDFSGASGSFGFGRGPWSLPSQLQLSWFSYLLATDGSGSSRGGDNVLQFGDGDVPRTSSSRSTPLVRNTVHPDRYYVKLKGIRVDGRDLTGIPAGTFDLRAADGTGGVFLSTTTSTTYLEEAAYNVVKRAFVAGIATQPVDGSALGYDLCYAMPSIDKQLKVVPKLTLVFDDGGTGRAATMELKKSNYFLADNSTGLECLTIMPSRGWSVLGSLLQADTNMTFDIHGEQLIFDTKTASFAPPSTASFAPPSHSKVSVVSLIVLAPLVAWVLLF